MWHSLSEAFRQASGRIGAAIGASLPDLIAFLIVVIAVLLLAVLVRFAVRRTLRAVRFDDRVGAWGFAGLADWSPSRSPTLLVARLASWTVVLFGIALAGLSLDGSLASAVIAKSAAYLPNLGTAVVVLAVGSFLARFLARSVLITAVNMQIQSAQLLSLGVKWLVLVFTGALVLDHLGIGRELVRTSFAILIGGIVLALALAVGLGSKDVVSRSWERKETEGQPGAAERAFRHL